MPVTTIVRGDATVTYEDTPEQHKAVFDHVVAWFMTHGCFKGEGIMQCEAPQLSALDMIAELADDVIKFQVAYSEGK